MKFQEFPKNDAISLSPKDYPWNERQCTHHQERRFHQLGLLHELTLEWIRTLRMEKAPYLMDRGWNSAAVENLWMLDSLAEKTLRDFLDDTSPEDVLGRLDYTIWSAQAYTLSHIFKNIPSSDQASMENNLEQAAWRLGRRTSEPQSETLPERARQDLSTLVFSYFEAPFFEKGRAEFLIKRAIRHEVQLELLSCPHQKEYAEILPVADPLCRIHSQWLRGYAYGLNPRIMTEIHTRKAGENQRCEHHWQLIFNSASPPD